MSLTLDDVHFLTSSAGERLLAELSRRDLSEQNTLSLLTGLRRTYTPQQAGAALTTARLRLQARAKFGDMAQHMLFTSDALQQASDPAVRRYRAAFTTGQQVTDAGCGIGSDSIAMAGAGAAVHGLDIDPVRVAIARHNAAAAGVQVRFDVGDIRAGVPAADFIFYDPARRDERGRRIYDLEAMHPPLSLVREWQADCIAVKLSPGVDLAQLAGYAGGVEFISTGGDLKEAVLWLDGIPRPPRATLLTDGQARHWDGDPLPEPPPIGEPRRWLLEPDPALLRAGLVQHVAMAFGGTMLDETIAYVTADTQPQSPWVRVWEILDWMPFHLKKLRAYLRSRGVGRVTVKKRGSPITPEELQARLKLKKGVQTRTLVLTRCKGQPVVLICQD